MKKTMIFKGLAVTIALVALGSCEKFMDGPVPQGKVSELDVLSPEHIEDLCIAAYAGYSTFEEINTSFTLWNYDVRSDDAYKGGNGTEDGDVFHALEVCKGVLPTMWNVNDMWRRLYMAVGRPNAALSVLEKMDEKDYPLLKQRTAEMRFLRAHGLFVLKQLFKYIVFAEPSTSYDEYYELSNRTYSNDEGWQLLADDFKYAYDNLPATQADKGRPTKASAAAYLAKVYLYKAYHQDNPDNHEVTSINADDLAKVVEYTEKSLYAGYGLAPDLHDNFRPEEKYENGPESMWAIQYSMDDGTLSGNRNWALGLVVPNIPGVTDGGCDFYKPSQNMVNAFRTDEAGHPLFDTFNDKDYDAKTDYVDPRLFLTCGIPGFPYEFNEKYMMEYTPVWSRSNGLYGYYCNLKYNVDPDSGYLIKGGWYGSPLNNVVIRYAEVMLMRAEALIQLNDGRIDEAMNLINQIRERAAQSLSVIGDYPEKYGVHFNVKPYSGISTKDEAMKALKFERRVELAMESGRFFDLVRWGEAAEVLNKYFKEEADNCTIYQDATFTKNQHEYLPLPQNQISASGGKYQQNCGIW